MFTCLLTYVFNIESRNHIWKRHLGLERLVIEGCYSNTYLKYQYITNSNVELLSKKSFDIIVKQDGGRPRV